MRTLTKVEDIKAVANNDNRSTMVVQMNKEVVDWLMSIGGKNREIISTNAASWRDCIRRGEWCVDNAEFKINSSCTWLIDGHHRTIAIDAEKAYGLLAKLIVCPDENAETVFRNQDCRGARRNLGVQATLAGIQNAVMWLAVERSYRCDLFADRIPSTIDSVERFVISKKEIIERIDYRRKFNGESINIPSVCIACLIRAAEVFPERVDVINAFWNRVITGEMITSHMPEFHLRNKIRAKGESKKDLALLTLKALSFAIDGQELGVLKLMESDRAKLSSRFSITSNKTKLGVCINTNNKDTKKSISRMSK